MLFTWDVHQLVGLVAHDRGLAHIDAEDALLQSEADMVGVGRAHGGEHGDAPWQPGLDVAVVVPEVLEGHHVLHVPVPSILADHPRPHAQPRPSAASDDLRVAHLLPAHRDAAPGVDVRRGHGDNMAAR